MTQKGFERCCNCSAVTLLWGVAAEQQERHSVRHLRQPGADAEQAYRLRGVLPVEHRGGLQVSSSPSALGGLSFSLCCRLL